jgi:hypothetical protein
MDYKTIRNKSHYIYDDLKEFKAFNPKEIVSGHWREGSEGNWVYTDDGYILEILKKSTIAHPGYKKPRTYIRTICGSYITEQNSHKILGEKGIAENIYAFSGNYDSNKDYHTNRKLKSREFLFARYIAEGNNTMQSFKKAYPNAQSDKYIREKSSTLINKESIQTMVKEEIKKILEDEGVTNEWIIGQYKDIASLAERDTDKLRSLESLSKIAGLFETETKKEQVSIWAGFTPEQIEGVKDGKETKIIAQAEKGKESS